jgi:hypothetical protein
MFNLGVQLGMNDSLRLMIRSLVCAADATNPFGTCPAVNRDWDRFASLHEVADYTNPKFLSALVGLPRHRINIVAGDHYSTAWTDEIFKLNRGATRVDLSLDVVTELSNHDVGSDPDFYPLFFYPGVTPLAWEFRSQRNIQAQNQADFTHGWPAWKSYPNDWGTATVGFSVYDADSGSAGADDPSNINFFPPQPTTMRFSLVPITACVQNVASCLDLSDALYTRGFDDPSAEVFYRMGTCVWSWLPGDAIDARSLCHAAPPAIAVHDARRREGDSGTSVLEFPVTLSAPSPVAVTVTYRTADGSATDGADYTALHGNELRFEPGETRKTVTVAVLGDALVEPEEIFTLDLDGAVNAIIDDDSALGTIVNDDASRLSIGNATRVEGNTGTTVLDFVVTLHGGNTGPVTVRYATSDGTATAGSDYLSVPDMLLTFAAGATTATISVQVMGDRVVEAPETFFVNLHGATNASIDVPAGLGTIVNDDADVPAGSFVLTDETGTPLGGTVFALTGFPIDLEAVIDAGTSPHGAIVGWGDRTSGAGTIGERDGVGVVSAQHAWKHAGTYTVRVSIADGGGVGDSRELTIRVLGGPDVACLAHPPILALLNDPSLDPQTRQVLTYVLGRLRGKLAGTARTGACDMFLKSDLPAGVARLVEAVAAIEALVVGEDGLNASQVGVMSGVETQLALAAKWTYLKLLRGTPDSARRTAAATVALAADAAMAARTYDVAVERWSEAVRILTAPR